MVRLKARYILFDILYPPVKELENYSEANVLMNLHSTSSTIGLKIIAELIRKSIQANFGDYGSGVAGMTLMVKYFSPRTSTGIVRCSRDHHQFVSAALTMINKINGRQVIVRVIRVCGTIKKCEEAAIERNRELMRYLDRRADAYGDDEKEIRNIEEDDEDLED